jgi:hypothetical protein
MTTVIAHGDPIVPAPLTDLGVAARNPGTTGHIHKRALTACAGT